jgi:hypothetical protein
MMDRAQIWLSNAYRGPSLQRRNSYDLISTGWDEPKGPGCRPVGRQRALSVPNELSIPNEVGTDENLLLQSFTVLGWCPPVW